VAPREDMPKKINSFLKVSLNPISSTFIRRIAEMPTRKEELSTDSVGIDEAIARVSEIVNRLSNTPQTARSRSGGTGNRIVDNTIIGPDMGIDSEGMETVVAGNRITSRQKDGIIRRLEEINSLLEDMKGGKDRRSKIRMLVDSFSGSETVIRTFLVASQFIARIVSR
jgi:hypothetical protein